MKKIKEFILRTIIRSYFEKKNTPELMKIIIDEYIDYKDSTYGVGLTTIRDHVSNIKAHINTAEHELLKEITRIVR